MIDFKTYTTYKQLPESWSSFVSHDIFLQLNYLKALEEASPNTLTLYYIAIFKNTNLVGVSIIQRVEVYAKDVFRSNTSSLFKQVLKTGISKILKGNILVVGNLTHTGQHGMYFNPEEISQKHYLETLYKALMQVKHFIKQNKNKKIRVVMFKDFFSNDNIHSETSFFKQIELHKVVVQPNMIMHIRPNWNTFNAYVDDLNKKYKRRLKTARNKFNGIERSELDLDTIKANQKQLHELYLNVSDNAKFNTFKLPENHFYTLKKELNNTFKVYGYFLKEELVGFYTLIGNNRTLETYFLGYNTLHQYQNQLYLNMLYDMAEFGIENNFKSIVYARTAMEIKSSVGAKTEDMFMYMKHTNRFANFLFKYIFKAMNPKIDWEERHPFK